MFGNQVKTPAIPVINPPFLDQGYTTGGLLWLCHFLKYVGAAPGRSGPAWLQEPDWYTDYGIGERP